jgi:hypothetical protein
MKRYVLVGEVVPFCEMKAGQVMASLPVPRAPDGTKGRDLPIVGINVVLVRLDGADAPAYLQEWWVERLTLEPMSKPDKGGR